MCFMVLLQQAYSFTQMRSSIRFCSASEVETDMYCLIVRIVVKLSALFLFADSFVPNKLAV